MRTLSTREITTVTGAGRRSCVPAPCQPSPPACNSGGSSSSSSFYSYSYSSSSSYSYSSSSSYSYAYSRSWASPIFYW